MIIKSPPVYDVSHYKEILDFALINPKPVLMGTKATEHTSFIDDKFVRFFAGMKQIGIARLAYHFFRKAYSPTAQAQHFCNFIRPYINNNDTLALDVEEGGETAAQLILWLEYVRLEYPNNLVILYSRKNILELIIMTNAQKEYFKNIPTWMAGYPLLPDLYNSIPSGYIADQTRFGIPYLWQYSDKGVITGIQGSVDLNWINPIYLAIIKPPDDGTPDPDPIPEPIPFDAEVVTAGLNLRFGAGTNYGIQFTMVLGDKLRCSGAIVEINNIQWWEIVAVNNIPVLGWASTGSGAYMKKRTVTPNTNQPQLYRWKHDIELPNPTSAFSARIYGTGLRGLINRFVAWLKQDKELWRAGVPEVFRLTPSKACNFGEMWQHLTYDLNTIANPLITVTMTKKKWRALYAYNRAFNNGTGFDEPNDPRRDYINKMNLKSPLPQWDLCRTCGGAVHTGREDGAYLWVDTMNGNKSPTAAMDELRIKYGETEPVTNALQWLLKHPWLYFDAVTVNSTGGIGRFPQGGGQRVFVPLVSSAPVKYPLNKLEKLPSSFDFKFYNPYKIP